MDGLIMDYPLTIDTILRRAETLFGGREIVSQRPDKSLHRYAYRDMVRRARQLGVALSTLGVEPGDRVATFCWNHHQHLEAYFGVPCIAAVLHTLNIRLHPDDIAYIVNHAQDKIVLVDEVLMPLFEKVIPNINVDHIIVISENETVEGDRLSYESLLSIADPADFAPPAIDEKQAAAMCYTSGTTGRPKGAVYSHRAIVLHSMASNMADVLALREVDTVLPVVPMFHVNAWGLPFSSTLAGAKQVYPGPYLDPASLVSLMEREHVTFSAGVPTIWLGILQHLDQHKGSIDLSTLSRMAVGGQAAPAEMIRAYKDRHGIQIVHAWGMTETAPLGSVAQLPSDYVSASPEEQMRFLSTQGRPVPMLEARISAGGEIVPWDGESMGELEVRGSWVSSSYHNNPEGDVQFTADGWFRTGDIVSIDSLGYITIKDRSKDVIKSGGEWISSIALENQLMAHPAVAEAVVIAVEHPKWLERPAAVVVLREGASASQDELLDSLRPHFAKWWIPDTVLFVNEIPRTSTGKFMKAPLRDRYRKVLVESGAVARDD
ncbi:MAG: long-chain fatty acid--CoA ligase [Nitrolancea sp.]